MLTMPTSTPKDSKLRMAVIRPKLLQPFRSHLKMQRQRSSRQLLKMLPRILLLKS